MTLEFIGYEFRELDSTLIRKCEPNTNFSVVLESFYRNSAVTGGDGSIFLDDATAGLDLSKDYQVMVRVTGRTYNISGMGSTGFPACVSGNGERRSRRMFWMVCVMLGKKFVFTGERPGVFPGSNKIALISLFIIT